MEYEMHSPIPMYLGSTPDYTETTQVPRNFDPTDWQVKDLGTPEDTMNRHHNIALIRII
jgi:hypothetical protein